ncbi:MAG: SGNH/GDSL hydrolase family protein [Clostridia bacterium]
MAKRIDDIDKNFKAGDVNCPHVHFKSCFEEPFRLYGFYHPYEEQRFLRLPPAFEHNERVNEGVRLLMHNTAGGRVRFQTDSPYVAIHAVLEEPAPLPHIAPTGIMGFDMYTKPSSLPGEPVYTACFVPHLGADGCSFDGVYHFAEDTPVMRDVIIHFPLYSKVSALYIGLHENAGLSRPSPYTIQKPVVFYGSSITQGACASRPGNCYTAILSRSLDCDILNLGFSGSAYGESAIADYIAGLSMSAFVLDYDYNARSEQELLDTHHRFYQIVREKNPELPIIMMSSPVAAPTHLTLPKKHMNVSRVIIMESYIKGFKSGDRHLYFIDGEALLGDVNAKDALVDGVHPTDLGFRYMANRVYPVLKDVLYHF